MNKTELISAVAEKAGITKKKSSDVVGAFTNTITEQLKKGRDVQILGFGAFGVTERAARDGRNPQTGETIHLAASKTPRFKPGKPLKDAINS